MTRGPEPRGVLHLIHKFDRRAGPDALVLGLLRDLDRRHWRPEVLLLDFAHFDAASLIEQAAPADVPVAVLPWRRGRGLPGIVAALRRRIARARIAVVHSHDIPCHLVMRLTRLAGFSRGPATVASVHGHVDGTPRQRLWSRIARASLPGLDHVVIGSPAMRPHLGFLPPERLSLIWNAVEVGHAAAPSAPPGGPLRLACLARLSREKGHAVLLEAVRLARDTGTALHLRIVGTGAEEPALRAQSARLGLEDIVEFAGFVEDATDAIRGADALVLASLQESLPLSVLEAMILGVPVITSAAGALPEVVADEVSGIVVPVGDAASLARAISRVAGDRALLARFAVAGRERALARHSLPAFVAATEALYDQLVAAR